MTTLFLRQAATLVGILLMGASTSLHATYITRTFSGTLTGVDPATGIPGTLQVGDPFTLTVGLNNDASDFNPSIPGVGLFLLDSATVFTATIVDSGSVSRTFSAVPTSTFVLIYDNYDTGSGPISRVDISGSTALSLPYNILQLSLYDDSNNILTSDQLSGLDLYGNWSSAYFQVSTETGISGIYANFSTSSPIPEPTTFALVCLGLAGLGFAQRRVK